MTAKRYTQQISYDGRNSSMVEFEHGEYVDYAHYRALQIALECLRETFETTPRQMRSPFEEWAIRYISDALDY